MINNIAWLQRKFPMFAVFGSGEYRLQPIYVDDLAELALMQGKAQSDTTVDAIGPETFNFRGLVRIFGEAIGCPHAILSVPISFGYLSGWVRSRFVGDVIITRPEIEGLMSDRLYVTSPPTGTTRLSDWVRAHGSTLGCAMPANSPGDATESWPTVR